MFVKKSKGPRTAILADGSVLTVADLPPASTRWVANRKAVVVNAVIHNLIGRDDAIRRYDLTNEEFDSWVAAVERYGKSALKVTKLQKYRTK